MLLWTRPHKFQLPEPLLGPNKALYGGVLGRFQLSFPLLEFRLKLSFYLSHRCIGGSTYFYLILRFSFVGNFSNFCRRRNFRCLIVPTFPAHPKTSLPRAATAGGFF